MAPTLMRICLCVSIWMDSQANTSAESKYVTKFVTQPTHRWAMPDGQTMEIDWFVNSLREQESGDGWSRREQEAN